MMVLFNGLKLYFSIENSNFISNLTFAALIRVGKFISWLNDKGNRPNYNGLSTYQPLNL